MDEQKAYAVVASDMADLLCDIHDGDGTSDVTKRRIELAVYNYQRARRDDYLRGEVPKGQQCADQTSRQERQA